MAQTTARTRPRKGKLFTDLPNEILLAAAARVPYSGKDLLDLSLTNKQFYELLKGNKQTLQDGIAKAQYQESYLLRQSQGVVRTSELVAFRATRSMVISVEGVIRSTFCQDDVTAVGAGYNSSALSAGLYVLDKIAEQSQLFEDEIVVWSFFMSLKWKTWALIRYTSYKIAAALRKMLAPRQGHCSLASQVSNPLMPLVIEEMALDWDYSIARIDALVAVALEMKDGLACQHDLDHYETLMREILPKLDERNFDEYFMRLPPDTSQGFQADKLQVLTSHRRPWSFLCTRIILLHLFSKDLSDQIEGAPIIRASLASDSSTMEDPQSMSEQLHVHKQCYASVSLDSAANSGGSVVQEAEEPGMGVAKVAESGGFIPTIRDTDMIAATNDIYGQDWLQMWRGRGQSEMLQTVSLQIARAIQAVTATQENLKMAKEEADRGGI